MKKISVASEANYIVHFTRHIFAFLIEINLITAK